MTACGRNWRWNAGVANPDLLQLFVRRIHDAGLPYLVVGSVGSTFYGEPRLTMDVDLAVAFSEAQVEKLGRLFPEQEFYVPPTETLREEAERPGGHWNIIHTATGLKADFYPCGTDAFFRWAWGQRQAARLEHGEIFYAPAEYILFWKVKWFAQGGGEKHTRDIRRMMELSPQAVDQRVLERELRRMGLFATFEEMLKQ